ncbi:MAG: orotidine-5'-phosphate decarboxylase [Firmicutes bacterium]|nr:orotidine-5'-phosphate decarboxylase [Bacillota bacterium]
MLSLKSKERLIIALDVKSKEEVSSICSAIGDKAVFYKVGLQLFLAEGWDIIRLLKDYGAKVFLDLKLHDIPYQVAGACREIVRAGVDMLTVHTMGGSEMMKEAALAVKRESDRNNTLPPILLGVTVLTSLNQVGAGEIGIKYPIEEQVANLAVLARKSGMDGVVASPQEVATIRKAVGKEFVVVTPGIRSSTDATNDQKRIMSAYDAIRAGSNYLVVGRPIVKADDPAAAAAKIVSEIEKASMSD